MADAGESGGIRCVILVDESEGNAFPSLSHLATEGPRRRALDDLAGSLLRRARDWAETAGGGEPLVLEMPRDADRLRSVEAATLLLIRPALVRLGPGHIRDLLDDLDNGCNVVIGPTLAGGWYLLALAGPARELVTAAGDGGPASTGRLIEAARPHRDLEVGLLRAERDLAGEPDLRAALADPLVDVELTRLLSAVLGADGQA